MKKFLTLLTILALFNFMGYSQNAPIDFEDDGIGANWTWTVFENDSNPPLEIIDNPDMSGINTSARVAQFTALEAGEPFAGFESAHGSTDLGPFVLDASNSIIKIMVWKSVISNVGVKLVSENGWAQPELLVPNTVVNEWEELIFDFSGFENPPSDEGPYDQIVIFGDFDLDGRTQDNVVYVDNIRFEEGGGGGDPGDEPTSAAPDPTEDPDDVISMFSDVYEDVEVDTWRTSWSSAELEDIEIDGNATKKYTMLDFVGIETTGDNLIDATEMEYFHIDVWTPNMDIIRVKLVDFGLDGEFGGGDDSEHEIVFDDLTPGEWHSLQIPLADFEGLASTENLAQYILSGTPVGEGTLFVDNVYFSKSNGGGGPGDEPLVAAPNPTEDPDGVISLFSDVYEDVEVDTWRTSWSSAELEDIEIQGNPTKKYTMLDFVGIETTGPNLINAANMEYFHIDVWTPNMDIIRMKLVDFGADGQFGGGDDSEHEIVFDNLAKGEWHSLQIPLDSFSGLMSTENMAQYILSGIPVGEGILYVDNVYFSGEALDPGAEPVSPAPDPTENADDVISMFSDVYEDVEVDTWRTSWSSAELEDIEIQGNPTKKYTMLDFVGVETTGDNLIDVSEMDYFHIDVWTPNMDVFRVKLVDFGPDGEFGGGDDSEHEIVFNNLTKGVWNSLQIPLDSFIGLENRNNIAQLIFSGMPVGEGTLYVDNVYYSKSSDGPGDDEPLVPAPDPTEDAENVISLFSDVYDDVEVDTWRTVWSQAQLEDIEIQGNPTKKYTMLDFVGIETTGDNLIDATEMEYFHIDVWTPNMDIVRVKLVDFGADGQFGGGDDTEHEIVFDNLAKGQWHSLQIPLEDFEGLASRANMAQYILSGTPVGQGILFVDNVYFSKTPTNTVTVENSSIKFYPNPTTGLINIESENSVSGIRIFNKIGQMVLSLENPSKSIDLGQLPTGLYFLQIESEGQLTVKKLMVK